MAVSRYQYQAPVVPSGWNSEERMYAHRVEELFDQVFAWRNTVVDKVWPAGSMIALEAGKDPNKVIGGKWQQAGSEDIHDNIMILWIRKG